MSLMCGIAGIAYFQKGKKVFSEEIKLMTDEIIHRGPDDSGVFISKNQQVGLGNRRLAVIDLSIKGHQPMTFNNRYTIVFNGEIYNYQKEKIKLIKDGYKFQSDSDTEVILALYSKYKKECVKYLRGMFAFAIYDNVENTIFLARDRIGKKPLKYSVDDSRIVFASELKAILKIKGIKKEIDPVSIQKFLLYRYTPAPMTGFVGINKLEPGNYIYINLDRKTVEKKRYWVPKFKNKLNLTEKEWSKKILSTLEDSTKIRMISDVPVGAFLSGGVDSSAVVAMMSRISTKPIQTFTVTFDDPKYSEKKYADNIVKMYKTEHHEILAKPSSVEILPEIAKYYEEPFADNSSVVSFLVSKETKKYVTVALNGDGGDETFAGYPNRYLRLKRDVDYANWISTARPLAALKINRISKFLEKSKLPLYEKFTSYNQIFSIDEIQSMVTNKIFKTFSTKPPYQNVRNIFEMFTGKDIKDAGLKFDLMYFLPDQLLTKMDIASMRYSLETRSPLLDHKMIELTGKIPFNLKVKNGETKYIFKKALEGIVPNENLYRSKVGFTIPLNSWFKGKLNSYAESLLLSNNSRIKEFINMDYIKPIIKSENINKDFGQQIWTLMMLEIWLKSYFS